MNNKCIAITILVLLFFLNTGYSQYYYTPDNSSTLLLISEKGDFKAAASIPIHTPFNFQVGYSPLKRLSVSLSYFKHKSEKEDFIVSTEGKSMTAAIGTYAFFKKVGSIDEEGHRTHGFLLDFYGGYTKSDISNTYASVTSSHLDYNKIFVQIGLHFKSRIISVSYATKLSSLDYKEGVVNGTPFQHELKPIEEEILVKEPYFLWETDLRFHIGPEYLRGYVGVSMINPNILDKTLISDRNIVFSTGLTFGIDEFFQMKKKKK